MTRFTWSMGDRTQASIAFGVAAVACLLLVFVSHDWIGVSFAVGLAVMCIPGMVNPGRLKGVVYAVAIVAFAVATVGWFLQRNWYGFALSGYIGVVAPAIWLYRSRQAQRAEAQAATAP